jgi:cobalt-zinc-cadmium resistance protein CzcA
MAAYGVMPADAQAVLEMAFGGKTASEMFDGERKFPIRLRYSQNTERMKTILQP